MMPTNIYYSPSKQKYFSVEEPICRSCKKPCEFVFFRYSNWFLKKRGQINPHQEFFYCASCIEKSSSMQADFSSIQVVIVISEVPKDAYLIINKPPMIQEAKGSLSVFDNEEIRVPVVTDRTKLSGRPGSSWEDVVVGVIVEDLESEKALLDVDEEYKLLLEEVGDEK